VVLSLDERILFLAGQIEKGGSAETSDPKIQHGHVYEQACAYG
jgi:hypothetical protein